MLFRLFPRPTPKTKSIPKALVLWVILLAGALVPACALGAEALDLRVGIPATGVSIEPYLYNNRHYLFLPGFCNREKLIAHVGEDGGCLEVKEGGRLTEGELTDAFAAEPAHAAQSLRRLEPP